MAELPTVESVFGARQAPSANSTIYSYNAGQEARAAQRVGETTSRAAADLGQIGQQRQKDIEDLDLIRAQTFAFKEYATLENEMRNDPDQSWEKYQPLFAQRAVAASSMIKNPTTAEKFRLGLEQDITQKQILSSEISKKKSDDQIYSEFIRDNEDMKNLASTLLMNNDPEGAAVALAQAERRSLAMAKAGVAGWDMTKHEIFMAGDAQKNKYDVLVNAYGNDSPEKIQEFLNGDSYINRLMELESFGGDPLAKNPNSSAKGRFQFTSDTAKSYGITAKFGTPEYEAQEIDAMKRLTNDNRRGLSEALGRSPQEWELYLAHQQGIGGAIALLANPNSKAIDVLIPLYKNEKLAKDAIKNNGGNLEMTAAEFSSKWQNKFNNSTGKIDNTMLIKSPIGYMSLDTRTKLLDFTNSRLKQVTPQRIQNDIMFATPQQINDSRQKYAGFEDDFNKQLQDRNKIIKDDNAGFINQHPSVNAYYNQMQQDPLNPDNRAQYFAAFDNAQEQIGVPAYLRNYIPKAEVEQIQTMLKAEPKLDDIQNAANQLTIKYKERLPEAISQMRRDGVNGAFIDYVLLSDEQSGVARNDLASALKVGKENLLKITNADSSELRDKVASAMEDVQAAWSKGDKSNLLYLAPQKAESIELLALQKMSEGMDVSKAVDAAKEILLPYQVIDDLVLPKSMPRIQANNVAITARAAKENLSLIDIMPPPELIDRAGGIDNVTDSLFQEYVRREVTAVVNGNDILFYDKTGNPLIERDTLESTGDEYESIYKRDLSKSAAVALGEEQSSADVIKLRSELSQYNNGIDLAMTKFNYGFMSRFMEPSIDRYDEKNPVLVKVNPILDEDLTALKSGYTNKDGVKINRIDDEKKKARMNNAYFKSVLSSLPKEAQSKFIDLAKKTNAAHIAYRQTQKEINNLKLDRNSEEYQALIAKRDYNRYLAEQGIGYNYIELPEWAK